MTHKLNKVLIPLHASYISTGTLACLGTLGTLEGNCLACELFLPDKVP